MKEDLKIVLSFVVILAAIAVGLAAEVPSYFRRKGPPGDVVFNDEIFLDAIAEVESGNNPNAIGPKGERTEYQFIAATWSRYTKVPFRFAGRDRNISRQVARDHLQSLKREMTDLGFGASPVVLAAAWRWRPASPAVAAKSDRAQRVVNLYVDLLGARRKK